MDLQTLLKSNSDKWLITGVAGLIGSNLLQTLSSLSQKVTGFDDFSSGSKNDLSEGRDKISHKARQNFEMLIANITDIDAFCE